MSYASNPLLIVCYSHDKAGNAVYRVAGAGDLKFLLEKNADNLLMKRVLYTTSWDPGWCSFHEMTPDMFAIHSGYWNLLPILCRQGYDLNRPLHGTTRLAYGTIENDYKSALDFFFFSTMAEIRNNRKDAMAIPHYHRLREVDRLLLHGLDVHKIEKDVVFKFLSKSLIQNLLKHYKKDDPYFPEIQSNVEPLLNELRVLVSLFRHGFSEFEWVKDHVSKYHWVGLLIQLVTHPGINKFSAERVHDTLPELIKTAAYLLVNFLTQCPLPPETLKKVAKFTEPVTLFHHHNPTVASRQMVRLMEEYTSMVKSPLSLRLLARNQVRKCLGGINFQKKVKSLQLPEWLEEFVSFIGPDQMEWLGVPPYLASLAKGQLRPSQITDTADLPNGGWVSNASRVDYWWHFG